MLTELGIIALFFIIVVIVFKIPPFRKIYFSSNRWQRSFYFIICFAAIFPLLERYYKFPVRLGIIKAVLLTILLLIYLLSLCGGKRYKICNNLRIFFLVFVLFVVFFVYILMKEIAFGRMQIYSIFDPFMNYVYYPLIAFFAYNEFRKIKAVENLLRLVFYLAIVMGVVGLVQYILGPVFLASTGMTVIREGWGQRPSIGYAADVREIDFFRVFSTLTDHQAYAAFLLLSLIPILYYFISSKKDKKYLIVLCFVIFSLLTTYSLTALLAVLLFFLTYFAMKAILEQKISKKLTFSLFFFITILLFSLFHESVNEAITSRLTYRKGTVYSRRLYFSNGVNAFIRQPFGYGFSRDAMASTQSSADCYWLWMLLQLGIVAFIFYLLIFIYPIYSLLDLIKKHKKKIPANKLRMIYLFLSFLIVNALFLNSLNNLMITGPANLIFWAIVGISLNKYLWIDPNDAQ